MNEQFTDEATVPSAVLEEERVQAFEAGLEFIKRVHRKHGFDQDRRA